MRDVGRYFDIISSMIRHSPAMDYEISYQETESGTGAITAILWFADGWLLDFTEVVEVRAYRPIKHRYTYHSCGMRKRYFAMTTPSITGRSKRFLIISM